MKKLAGEMDAGGAKRVYTPFWNFSDPKGSTAVKKYQFLNTSLVTG